MVFFKNCPILLKAVSEFGLVGSWAIGSFHHYRYLDVVHFIGHYLEVEVARTFELVVTCHIVGSKGEALDVPSKIAGGAVCIVALVVHGSLMVVLLHVKLDSKGVLVAYGFVHHDVYIIMITVEIFLYIIMLLGLGMLPLRCNALGSCWLWRIGRRGMR